jgi:putative tricarboxylic transport membrane protein
MSTGWSRRIVAVGFLVAALVVLAEALTLPEGGGYQAVGPRAFPLLVGTGLAVVAVIGLVQAFPRRRPVNSADASDGGAERPEEAIQWRPVLALVAALAGYAALIGPVGYWQSTTLFFTVCARVLGSRRLLRDFVVALMLALATYVLFDRVLGITLPPGLIRLAI